jgi:hypothetical protein
MYEKKIEKQPLYSTPRRLFHTASYSGKDGTEEEVLVTTDKKKRKFRIRAYTWALKAGASDRTAVRPPTRAGSSLTQRPTHLELVAVQELS